MVKQTDTADKKHPYKRKVTHTEYSHGNKKAKTGGISSVLQLRITENKHNFSEEDVKSKRNISEANDKYIRGVVAPYITAYWGGGLFYFYSQHLWHCILQGMMLKIQ